MRHDLLTLELLLAVARERSITRGASRVHLALASASKRLTDLEARLGVNLLNRNARGVEPTDECLGLLMHLNAIKVALEDFDRDAAEFSRGIKGFVRIAVASDAIVEGLLPGVAKFLGEYPGVHIKHSAHTSTEVEEFVARGDAQVGVYMQQVHGTRLQSWPFAQGRWVALVPRGHALAGRRGVAFEDMLDFTLLNSNQSSSLEGLMIRAANSRGIRIESHMEVDGVEATALLVEAGAGLAVVTDKVAALCASRSQVEAVPLENLWATYEVVIGVARDERRPVAVERLVKALRTEHVKTKVGWHSNEPPTTLAA